MNLGLAIKIARKKLKFTQDDLKEETGLSQTAISLIEKGVNTPTKETIEKIAKALDIPSSLIYLLAIEKSEVQEDRGEMYDNLFPTIKDMAMRILGADGSKKYSEISE